MTEVEGITVLSLTAGQGVRDAEKHLTELIGIGANRCPALMEASIYYIY